MLFIASLLFVQHVSCSSQTWSSVSGANGIAIDRVGNLFVSSTTGNIIYQLFEGYGTPVRFAGTGAPGKTDGNAYDQAQFNQPRGITIKSSGELYVCDYGNNAIRKISGGTVSTVVSVPSPVDITVVGSESVYSYTYSYWSWYWNGETFVNPSGLYVTSESGEVYFINEGPTNDDCPFAIPLNITGGSVDVHGTTVNAHGETYVPPCPVGTTNTPLYSAWYTFVGTGEQVNITTCNQATSSEAALYVYRDAAPNATSCSALVCMGEQFRGLCGTVTLCTQPNLLYYVVVSSPYQSEEGTFQLTVQNLGSTACSTCSCSNVQCGSNNCGGYCANATTCPLAQACVDSTCTKNAANSVCLGAIAMPSANSTVSGNTQLALGGAPFIPAFGDCLFPENSGLWYSFVGTGDEVQLSTCSLETNFDTVIHVYKQMDYDSSCSELLCIVSNDDYYCESKTTYSFVSFCSEVGVTYYYFVEGFGHGAFELTQTVTVPCTPGEYYSYWYWYYNYFYFYNYFFNYNYFFYFYYWWPSEVMNPL